MDGPSPVAWVAVDDEGTDVGPCDRPKCTRVGTCPLIVAQHDDAPITRRGDSFDDEPGWGGLSGVEKCHHVALMQVPSRREAEEDQTIARCECRQHRVTVDHGPLKEKRRQRADGTHHDADLDQPTPRNPAPQMTS